MTVNIQPRNSANRYYKVVVSRVSRKLLSAIERLHNDESDSWAQFARHYLTADQPLSTMCQNQLIVVDSSPPISKVSEIRELG